MTNYQFEKTARINRSKAMFFTILFHVAVIGAVVYSGDFEYEKYIPETVKEWVGMDEHQAEQEVAPRP